MDLEFSAEEVDFREEVATWLSANVPRDRRPTDDRQAMRKFDLAWQATQHQGGWAGISWPAEYGGRGVSFVQKMIWHEEYALAGAPSVGSSFVGLNHAGPTLIVRGSPEQQQTHLDPILRGEVLWCQGFSEPEAGSDLAALRTRAVVDGDHLVVTGQKVWTSYADVADYQELLVRTNPDASKHEGISWLICDMHSPGIEVRPILTITGEKHFCEVFYDEVRVPIANAVGGIDNGWSVTRSTLAFERGTAFIDDQIALLFEIEELIDRARTVTDARSRALIEDDEFARRLATARAEGAALLSMTYASISRAQRNPEPGTEGTMIRLYYSELSQRVAKLALDMAGSRAIAYSLEDEPKGSDAPHMYFNSFRRTIGAGTSDILRNVIAERALGLPRHH